MASYFSSFLPQSVQKRILKYILTTYVPVLDSSTLDLDNLDVQIGRKSVISLSDVGIDGAKLHAILDFSAELQITAASVGSLTIHLPADLHKSGIEVFVDRVKVIATLLSPQEAEIVKSHKKKGRRKDRDGRSQKMRASILPSPEEVARDFVQKQPKKVKRELEKSMAAFGEASEFWKDGLDSSTEYGSTRSDSEDEEEDDIVTEDLYPHQQSPSRRTSASSTHSQLPIHHPDNGAEEDSDSDDEASSDGEAELGTGTSLSLPGFVASFIKGIGDRFQLHVGEVALSIQIPKSQAFPNPHELSPPPMDDKLVTLELRIAGVAIEGVTFATAEVDISAFAPSGSGQIKEGKRKIQLNRLNAFLIGDESWFDEAKPGDLKNLNQQQANTGFDGTQSKYDEMKESVCTVRGADASVATLRAVTPPLPASSPPPASDAQVILTRSKTPSVTSSEEDVFTNPDEFSSEYDHMAASVVSLGSFSDNGTAPTSQADRLTESQMFADLDSDSDGEPDPDRGQNDNGEDLPFAMASYMASAEEGHVLDYSRPAAVYEEFNPENIPLPMSPMDLSVESSQVLKSTSRLPPPRNISTVGEIVPDSGFSLNPPSTSIKHLHSSISGAQHELSGENTPAPPPAEYTNPGGSSPMLIPQSMHQSTASSIDGPYGSFHSQANSETESEDDEVARSKLCESMYFSHAEAGSLYLSAMSGADGPDKHMEQSMLDGSRDVDNALTASRAPGDGAGGRRKGEIEGEELSEAELEARLDRLVGVVSRRGSIQDSPLLPPTRLIRKKIAEIDYVEVWIPALSEPATTTATSAPHTETGPAIYSTDNQPNLPGAFSIYGASPPSKKHVPVGGSSSRPITPKSPIPGVKFAEDTHSPGQSPSHRPEKANPFEKTREKDAEVEVFVGKVEMKADIVVGGLLLKVLGVLGALGVPGQQDAEAQQTEADNSKVVSGKRLEVVVGEVDCRLVDRAPSQVLMENGQPEPQLAEEVSEGEVIFDLNLQHTRATMSTLVPKPTSSMAGQIVNMTKIAFANIEIRDTKGAFIQFVTKPPTCLETSPHGHPGKRRTSTEKGVAMQSDVRLTVTSAGNKTKIEVQTLPLHIQCQLGRVEELLANFGGFGSVLGLSTAGLSGMNTPTQNTPKPKGVSWKEEKATQPNPPPSSTDSPAKEMKFDCNIGGLIVDIEGEDAAIGLRTSVIKIRKRNELTTIIGIEKMVVVGPDLVERIYDSDARIIIENTRMEFSTKPNEEDLARLLKLLTPSKDKFAQDDDILLDTLFEQRRQASVLRVSVARVKAEVEDLKECERFQSLGDELTKLMAVTKYMPQDETPGLLTLLYMGAVDSSLELGEVMGRLDLGIRNLDLSHVSGPNLVALAMGTVGLRRNGDEELIGEGLPKEIAIRGFANHAATGTRKVTDDEDRPMVMVRLLGDDPEPVIKIKLWNLRIEYNVDTLMALMNSPNVSGDEIAREMVDSIATLTERQVRRDQKVKKKKHVNSPLDTTMMASPTATSAPKPLRVEVVIRDSVLGLNPLGLPSRGLFALTEAKVYIELPSPKAELEVTIEMKRASVLLIDDVANLLTAEEATHEAARHRRRKEAFTETLAAFAELGYVSIATISSARAILKLVESEVPGDKCIDLEVWDDLFFMETCADSTQTLLGIVNGLKPPLPEGEEVKYCTEVMPLDMFASMIEDAFVPAHRKKTNSEAGPSSSAVTLPEIQESTQEEDTDGDMVADDVPMNLTFVESYYGNPHVNYNYSQEELAEEMLDDDLTQLAKPSRPLAVGERGVLKTFEEQVQMLDDTPLEILDNHFSVVPRASLIEMAANSAIGAPIRVKVRDVHVIWNLHDGYDWPKTRDTISKAVKKVEGRALQRRSGVSEARASFDMEDDDPESVIGDLLFNSIYIGIPANRDPKELSRQINSNLDAADMMSETGSYASTGLESRPSNHSRANLDSSPSSRRTRGSGGLKLARSRTHKMQIELKGVSADFVLFPQNGGETQSSVDLKVGDMEIIDNVPTSRWKKFITYMRDAGKRETNSQMAHIEVLNIKPVPTLAASELVIKATILPLRLHVDQDTLDFLTRFFEFKDDTVVAATPPQEEPFIQRIEVNSVRVKLDYKPKRVDYVGLRSGHTTEFMNFVTLEEADMVLKHVILHGISGFTKLSKALNDTWMPDIQKTQLGDVLAGVAPVRSLVNIGSGVKDLVVVPMREYRKDGRIIRSMSKGMVSFASKTTKELVRLGAKVAVGTQTMLENTEEFLGGQGSGSRAAEGAGAYYYHVGSGDSGDDYDDAEGGAGEEDRLKVISLYADQPKNVAQGLRTAGVSFKKNLISAREALRAVPGEVAERGSAQGVVAAVARAAPVAMLRPMIGASEAVSRTLLGVTNSLDREMVRRVDDKYKKH
ncbi:hypothetical protein DFH27DRAFT_526134 [Peziza echinospora]|nr:hypothetical protein DFH27DRAFT_526134 [Peziza echinospora]